MPRVATQHPAPTPSEYLSELEQEEEQKHWESYGLRELERALRNVDDNLDDNFETCLEATGEKTLGSLYWSVCLDTGKYPEKIDSNAYDFGIENRRGGIRDEEGGWAVVGCWERLVPESMRGLTPEQFLVALDARLEADRGLSR